MPQISAHVKDYAWNEFQELDKNVRYYGELASKYQSKHSRIQMSVFWLSLAIPTILGAAPKAWILPVVLGFVLAGLVGWDFIGGHANKAAVLHGITVECERIYADQAALFFLINNDQIEESEARERLRELARRTIDATGRSGYAQVSFDFKLSDKCWKDSKNVLMKQESASA